MEHDDLLYTARIVKAFETVYESEIAEKLRMPFSASTEDPLVAINRYASSGLDMEIKGFVAGFSTRPALGYVRMVPALLAASFTSLDAAREMKTRFMNALEKGRTVRDLEMRL